MTRNKKLIYGTVIGVAGSAFVVDRLRGSNPWSGPEEASAAAPQYTSETITLAGGVDADRSRIRVQPAPFPTFGPDPVPQGDVRNIFLMTQAVQELLVPPTSVSAEPGQDPSMPQEADPGNLVSFLRDHRLSGVMLNGRLRFAVVNGRWVQEGQEIDGCTLSKIEGERAVFECRDGIVELSVGANRE